MNLFVLLMSFYPIFYLIIRVPWGPIHNLVVTNEFQNALRFTLLQAFLSATFSVFLALLAAPGYAQLGKLKKGVRSLLIFPQVVSPVFVVLSLLITWNKFPYGIWGVVIGHAFINAGLCLIILGEKWESIRKNWFSLSQYLGAKDYYYLKKVIIPLMGPHIKTVFTVVFTFCLSSLLVPLVLGGGPSGSTLEVLIYEKIKASADVSGALFIAMMQFFIQYGAFMILIKSSNSKSRDIKIIYTKPKYDVMLVPAAIIIIILVSPYLKLLEIAFSKGPTILFPTGFYSALINSTFIATGVAMGIFVTLCFWSLCGPQKKIPKIPALSHVIIGLAGFLIFGLAPTESKIFMLFAVIISHLSGFLLPVIRFVSEPLDEISHKYSPVLNLICSNRWTSKWYFFKKVFYPLEKKIYFLGFLIAFSWSFGEFSISMMIAPSQATLPLFIQSLLSQYRLEEAAALSLVFLVVGFFVSILGESFFYGKT